MLLNEKSPHGGDVYANRAVRFDFSANVNPFGMPEPVREALRRAADECVPYPDPYCTALREKLSAAEGVPAGQILVGNGAAELIYQFAYALPKDRPVLILAPTFCEYERALDAAGVPHENYLLRPSDGYRLTGAVLDLDFSRFGAVVLCSPNNPTGITVDRALLEALAETGVRLFCDFCFFDLTDDPDRYDVPALLARCPNVLVLRAFTKSFAMAGVRLGYLLGSDTAFLADVASKAQCWNVSTLAQRAGVAALDCRGWLTDCVRSISAERTRLADGLRSLGTEVFPGEANYLLFRTDPAVPARLLARGILVRDCSAYTGLGPGFVRVAVRTSAENELLLNELAEVLKR